MGSLQRTLSCTYTPGTLTAAGLLGVALAWLLHSIGATGWLHGLLAVSHHSPGGEACDAVVVLGYALHKNGSCTRPLQSRVEEGVALWRSVAARHVILSGAHPGSGLRNVSEASAMSAYALRVLGQDQPAAPPDGWLLEEQSTSTRTNALFSMRMVAAHGWRRVLLVTNPFHQRRSYLTFQRVCKDSHMDVELYMAEVPFAGHAGWGCAVLDAAMDQLDFWRELAALAYYWARGWL